MTEPEISGGPGEANSLAGRLSGAQSELRTLCEAEGLLSIYEEVHEHFHDEAYKDYSVKVWLRDAEFRHAVRHVNLAGYQISLVLAYIVGSRNDLIHGRPNSVPRNIEKAKILTQELKALLPEIYIESIADEPNTARVGGYVKDLKRKCRSILKRLEINHDLEGIDFKSFEEAASYAIEMMIHDEQPDAKAIYALRKYYPHIFRQWLGISPKEAEAFKRYTGFAWNE